MAPIVSTHRVGDRGFASVGLSVRPATLSMREAGGPDEAGDMLGTDDPTYTRPPPWSVMAGGKAAASAHPEVASRCCERAAQTAPFVEEKRSRPVLWLVG